MSLISLLKSGRFAHLRSAAAEDPKDTTDDAVDEEKLEDGDESETDAAKAKRARKAKKAEGDDNASDLDGEDLDDDEDDDEDEDDDKEDAKKARKAKKAEDDDASPSAAFRRGRMAERERCAAIFASRAGVLRPDMAAEVAFNSGMSVEKAVAFLDRAVAKTTASRLADRMATVQVPNPGSADAHSALDPSDPKAVAQRAIAAAAKARGR